MDWWKEIDWDVRRKIYWALITVIVVLTLLCALITAQYVYTVHVEIDSLLDRAEVATTAPEMADRVERLLRNMEKHGVTEGYVTIILGDEKSDVALDYQDLSSVLKRARIIAELDEKSQAYQSGMDDLRGIVKAIDIDAATYVLLRCPLMWSTLGLLILLVVVSLMFYIEKERARYTRRYAHLR